MSLFILIGTIAFSYYTKIGWWAFAGLTYFIYARLHDDDYEVAKYIFLSISILLFITSIFKMGWIF